MEEALKNFHKQFDWKAEVLGEKRKWAGENIIVSGMGGSQLSPGLLKFRAPDLPIISHRDYDLPPVRDLDKAFLIASSYSGNTEEVISFLNKSLEKGLKLGVISSGGEIYRIAEENNLTRVKMPSESIQPRVALGYSLLALAEILGMSELSSELSTLSPNLSFEKASEEGKDLAEKLFKKTVIIYSSNKNKEISYNWKIKINETAKVPAFANVIPEMNHNEISSFMNHAGTPTQDVAILFVEDDSDLERNRKRMEITKEIAKNSGFGVFSTSLSGDNEWKRLFGSLMVADWTAYHLAKQSGVNPDNVPVIEEFKGKMKE